MILFPTSIPHPARRPAPDVPGGVSCARPPLPHRLGGHGADQSEHGDATGHLEVKGCQGDTPGATGVASHSPKKYVLMAKSTISMAFNSKLFVYQRVIHRNWRLFSDQDNTSITSAQKVAKFADQKHQLNFKIWELRHAETEQMEIELSCGNGDHLYVPAFWVSRKARFKGF